MPTVTVKTGFEFHGGPEKPNPPLIVPDPKDPKTLWPHQVRFVKELVDQLYWIMVGPPAAGKTLTIAALVLLELERDPKQKCIIAVPQKLIGSGFQDCVFMFPENQRVFSFDPRMKLHLPITETSNSEALRTFLQKQPTSSVRDRVVICTHQTLVMAHDQFPKLFHKKLRLVVDEAHHAKVDEQDDRLANCLGRVAVDLIKHKQRVGLATATAFRGDGAALVGQYRDRFKIVELPFDDYLGVCNYFRSFGFDFILYRDDFVDSIHRLLGDKRKAVPCTIITIPNVHSRVSSGKDVDLNYVYAGIAGVKRFKDAKIRNRDGSGDGITLVQRGRRWIRIVDLVNEKNRELKRRVIVAAHDDPDASRIDVIVALEMFKEGANWRWAQQSIIIGYRGSFVELTQMVGRVLRDAPGKQHADIHYLLPVDQDPDDDQISAMDNYLKALLLVLILENQFRPVTIRFKDPETKCQRIITTNLLSEAVGYDTAQEILIQQAVFEALLQHDQLSSCRAIQIAVETLQQEGVQHPKVPLETVAQQILRTHQRRSTALKRRRLNADGFDTAGIDIDLLDWSDHPIGYMQYYAEAIGAPTLAALRTALQNSLEAHWEEMYELLTEFVEEKGRLTKQAECYKGRPLGVWVCHQRQACVIAERRDKLELISCWTWNNVKVELWWINKNKLEHFFKTNHKLPPSKSELGVWLSNQKSRHQYLSGEKKSALISIHPAILMKYRDIVWEDNFTKLSDLGMIPSCSSSKELNYWCKTQRTRRYKMSSYRRHKLESLSFWTWNGNTSSWQKSYNKVLREAKSTKYVPRNNSWCETQRQLYAKNKLSQERIDLLNKIPGWLCEPRKNSWVIQYQSLADEAHKIGCIPTQSTQLGRWCSKQRIKYRQNKLSQECIDLLNKIPGWWWNQEDKD